MGRGYKASVDRITQRVGELDIAEAQRARPTSENSVPAKFAEFYFYEVG
jgi:hypothetical protein